MDLMIRGLAPKNQPLFESTRRSPGLCLALFQTKASKVSLSKAHKICSAYDDVKLLASLFAEGVSIIVR
jgi:hypothetical protein